MIRTHTSVITRSWCEFNEKFPPSAVVIANKTLPKAEKKSDVVKSPSLPPAVVTPIVSASVPGPSDVPGSSSVTSSPVSSSSHSSNQPKSRDSKASSRKKDFLRVFRLPSVAKSTEQLHAKLTSKLQALLFESTTLFMAIVSESYIDPPASSGDKQKVSMSASPNHNELPRSLPLLSLNATPTVTSRLGYITFWACIADMLANLEFARVKSNVFVVLYSRLLKSASIVSSSSGSSASKSSPAESLSPIAQLFLGFFFCQPDAFCCSVVPCTTDCENTSAPTSGIISRLREAVFSTHMPPTAAKLTFSASSRKFGSQPEMVLMLHLSGLTEVVERIQIAIPRLRDWQKVNVVGISRHFFALGLLSSWIDSFDSLTVGSTLLPYGLQFTQMPLGGVSDRAHMLVTASLARLLGRHSTGGLQATEKKRAGEGDSRTDASVQVSAAEREVRVLLPYYLRSALKLYPKPTSIGSVMRVYNALFTSLHPRDPLLLYSYKQLLMRVRSLMPAAASSSAREPAASADSFDGVSPPGLGITAAAASPRTAPLLALWSLASQVLQMIELQSLPEALKALAAILRDASSILRPKLAAVLYEAISKNFGVYHRDFVLEW
jgi:hypothetical protein